MNHSPYGEFQHPSTWRSLSSSTVIGLPPGELISCHSGCSACIQGVMLKRITSPSTLAPRACAASTRDRSSARVGAGIGTPVMMSTKSPSRPRMKGPPAKPIPAAFVPPQITFDPASITSSRLVPSTPKQSRRWVSSQVGESIVAGKVGRHSSGWAAVMAVANSPARQNARRAWSVIGDSFVS